VLAWQMTWLVMCQHMQQPQRRCIGGKAKGKADQTCLLFSLAAPDRMVSPATRPLGAHDTPRSALLVASAHREA